MPREAKAATPSDLVQPGFFTDDDFPDMPEVVTAAQTWECSGKVLGKDGERLSKIVELKLGGASDREIARRIGCRRSNVRVAVAILEGRGMLEPLKERVSRKLGLLVETSLDYTQELIDGGLLPAQCAPIVLGVAFDKKAVLDGMPTETVRVEVGLADGVLAELRRAKADILSGATIAQAVDLQGVPGEVMSLQAPGSALVVAGAADPGAAGGPPPVRADQGGGGGSARGGGQAEPDGPGNGNSLDNASHP